MCVLLFVPRKILMFFTYSVSWWVHVNLSRGEWLTALFLHDLKSRSVGPCPSIFSVAKMSVNEMVRAHSMQLFVLQLAVSWLLDRK